MSDISIITRLLALGKGETASFERVSTHTDIDYRFNPTLSPLATPATPVEQAIHSCGADAAVLFQRARQAIRHLNTVERETAVAANLTHYEVRSYTLETQVKCVPMKTGMRIITTLRAEYVKSTTLSTLAQVPDILPLEE